MLTCSSLANACLTARLASSYCLSLRYSLAKYLAVWTASFITLAHNSLLKISSAGVLVRVEEDGAWPSSTGTRSFSWVGRWASYLFLASRVYFLFSPNLLTLSHHLCDRFLGSTEPAVVALEEDPSVVFLSTMSTSQISMKMRLSALSECQWMKTSSVVGPE